MCDQMSLAAHVQPVNRALGRGRPSAESSLSKGCAGNDREHHLKLSGGCDYCTQCEDCHWRRLYRVLLDHVDVRSPKRRLLAFIQKKKLLLLYTLAVLHLNDKLLLDSRPSSRASALWHVMLYVAGSQPPAKKQLHSGSWCPQQNLCVVTRSLTPGRSNLFPRFPTTLWAQAPSILHGL